LSRTGRRVRVREWDMRDIKIKTNTVLVVVGFASKEESRERKKATHLNQCAFMVAPRSVAHVNMPLETALAVALSQGSPDFTDW